MHRRAGAALAAGLAVALALLPSGAFALDRIERTALHSAMIQHIDRLAVDGLWLKVDVGSGEVRRFAPSKAHPMILQLDQAFVLCTDFVSMDGQSVNVDFYAVRSGDGFAVFQTEIGNRSPLEALVAAGHAVPVD